jgi:hypothetical protein
MKLAKQVRIVLLMAAVAAAVLTTPSLAATPRSCTLLTDAAGDAQDQPYTTPPSPNQPELDIVSGDVASDQRSVTTVIRVAHLGTAMDSPGQDNQFRFTFWVGSDSRAVTTYASRSVDAEDFFFAVAPEGSSTYQPLSRATGVFDVANNQVRVTVPLAEAAHGRIIRRDTRLTHLGASTWRGYGLESAYTSIATGLDTASSGKTYLVGSPSCVAVGQ